MLVNQNADAPTSTVTTAAASSPPTGAAGRSGLRDAQRLGQQLHALFAEAADEGQLTQRFLELVCRTVGAIGVLYLSADSAGTLSADPVARVPSGFGEGALAELRALAMVAQAEGVVQLARADVQGTSVLFAVPVLRPGRPTECLLAAAPIAADDHRQIAGLSQMLQGMAAFAGLWRGRLTDVLQVGHEAQWQQFARAVASAAAAETKTAAATQLAAALAHVLPARLVAVGLGRRGGLCQVLGIVPQQRFDAHSEMGVCLESVLAESMLQLSSAADGAVPDGGGRATDSVTQLLRLAKADQLLSAPLRDAQQQVIGACLVLLDAPPTDPQRQQFTLGASLIGPPLDLVRRASSGPRVRWSRLRRQVAQLTPRGRAWLAASVLASAMVLFALPLPYRVKCSCEVQPVTRRYVVAPYEGRLESAAVEPGDWVSAGQVLARMDAADIRLEMAGLQADLQRATKQRDSALASRETAAAQISLLEMERLQLRIDLLQERMNNLEIRSPTEGVVIAGDPKKLQGARLTMGQTLVEVGPMRPMVLEVAIRDEDVAQVRVGVPVQFRLQALPHAKFSGELARIYPRSEPRAGHNVFVGAVDISSDPQLLRPGMQGRAKLLVARRSLFWILFHRAWEHVLLRIG